MTHSSMTHSPACPGFFFALSPPIYRPPFVAAHLPPYKWPTAGRVPLVGRRFGSLGWRAAGYTNSTASAVPPPSP